MRFATVNGGSMVRKCTLPIPQNPKPKARGSTWLTTTLSRRRMGRNPKQTGNPLTSKLENLPRSPFRFVLNFLCFGSFESVSNFGFRIWDL
jgi:hypothetical protein